MQNRNAETKLASYSSFITRHSLFILQQHLGLLLALLVYLLLAFSYFFIVPMFEGPDEWTHTGHVKYMAEGNGLPVMLPGRGIWGGQQPPLYYALGALLVQPFELDGVADYEENRRNPHASLGYALDPGNKNNYLHQPSERFPYRGLSLTVHVLRLYSMLFGLITIIFVYLTAYEIYDFGFTIYDDSSENKPSLNPPFGRQREGRLSSLALWERVRVRAIFSPVAVSRELSHFPQNPKSFATFVALFVACQPMFAFITASVANEPANIAFSAIGLWLAQRYVLRGPSRHWGRAAALGLTLGLISLSKMTGLSFGLVAVVAMLITAITTRKQPGAARLLWRDGVIIGALFLAVGGWWYWRNFRLYGDFFQQGLYEIYFNDKPDPLSLSDFLYTLSTGEVSFWATFGWLNIAAPDWVYAIYRIISRVGLIGVALALVVHIGQRMRRRTRGDEEATPLEAQPATNDRRSTTTDQWPTFPPALIIHLVFPVALAFSLTRLVAIEGGLQGRQLLPALGSIAIVIIWGWWLLVPTRLRAPVMAGGLALLFGLTVWLPYGVVAPAYIPRPLLTEAELPADLSRLDLIYNGDMKLIGAEVGTEVVRPGERVPVTAYWQALKPMETNYSVFVHLIGRDYTVVGQLNTYPGLGLRPTRTLEPGQIVADTYSVLVEGGSQAPTRLLVNIGLFDFDEPGRPGIPPATPTGEPASPTVGQLKLVPREWPAYDGTPPLAEFGQQIWLVDYAIDTCHTQSDDCQLILKWLARGRPATDYTVFIQLWRDNEFVQGFDAPPLNNDYPTGLWAAGELIRDPHSLDLSTVPPGDYEIRIGLYNFATGDRLAATSGGTPLADNALALDTIEVKQEVGSLTIPRMPVVTGQ